VLQIGLGHRLSGASEMAFFKQASASVRRSFSISVHFRSLKRTALSGSSSTTFPPLAFDTPNAKQGPTAQGLTTHERAGN
jgi:hypothetical protein